jgi:hypothetical protein
MSTSTRRRGDGQVGLTGGTRISDAYPHGEDAGTIEISQSGFVHSICRDASVRPYAERVRRELQKLGSLMATPPEIRAVSDGDLRQRIDMSLIPAFIGENRMGKI